jgi:hypothetical protein
VHRRLQGGRQARVGLAAMLTCAPTDSKHDRAAGRRPVRARRMPSGKHGGDDVTCGQGARLQCTLQVAEERHARLLAPRTEDAVERSLTDIPSKMSAPGRQLRPDLGRCRSSVY